MQSARRVALVLFCGLAVAVAAVKLGAPNGRPTPIWIDPLTGQTFLFVQSGTFSMGTPPGEALREPQEALHRVRLSRPFYLGRNEVTQEAWARVMGANPSQFQPCPTCPVERVSFYDVQRFLERLNASGEPGFRLPTEAEWEYACRAGDSQAFGARATLSSDAANIDGTYPYEAPPGPARGRTIPVGRFPANAWGFHDMSGNVWEWVQDWHCPYTGDATDPIGRCDSSVRVIRGGSWKFDGGSARCGLRYTHRPQDSGYSLGVRLAHDSF